MVMRRSLETPAIQAMFLCACIGTVPVAVAQDFSWQVAGRYEDANVDYAAESRHSSLRGTYYLSPVDDQAGPWELAPFLSRSSYVTVGTARVKHRQELFRALLTGDAPGNFIDLPNDTIGVPGFDILPPVFGSFPSESGIDTSGYAFDGRYVWPGTGWYAGAHAGRSDGDVLPPLPFAQTRIDDESSSLFAGRYFGARTTLELGLGTHSMSQDVRFSPFDVFDPTFGLVDLPGIPELPSIELQTGIETETDDARLSFRHVGDLSNWTFSVGASLHSSRSDTRLFFPLPPDFFAPVDAINPPVPVFVVGAPNANISVATPNEILRSERERQVSVSGALFPNPAVGVRLTYTNKDRELGSSDLVRLSATWFFVRNAAVEVELIRTRSGRGFGGVPESDAVAVRLLGRF